MTVKFTTKPADDHITYNMTFALAAFAEGFEVYIAHPEDDDVRMWSEDEIEESEGHLFVIKMDTTIKEAF